MKKIRRYNLLIDIKYKIIRFEYVGLEGVTTCQNCDRVITNTATVENEKGERFVVGLDCAETLSFAQWSDQRAIQEQVAKHNKLMRYVREVKNYIKAGYKVTTSIGTDTVSVFYNGISRMRMKREVYEHYFKNII